ncbi:10378_t:CDS:2 [Cetraspora pellucida]|uniref:10378_t:CDS:1 n=1 Tax=Cetraspora pellucida TaxID=1433469 RepID=A0A9N9F7X7_9GLOM|nr:10378_t:CDS:2 [Cetraspora pellucida]
MSRTLISLLIKSTFHCGRHKSVQPRLLSTFEKICSYSRSNIERLDMLKKKEYKNSPNLLNLGKFGRTTFAHLSGMYKITAEYTDFLKAIDGLKAYSRISSVDILKRLTKNFSLNDFLKNIDMPLPAPSSLSDKPENEVIEIRNHLLATYFLYNTFYELDHEINLDDIKTTEIEAHGSIYIVYPLPLEVPALMEKFIQFRDESQNSSLHPLIIASHILSTFLHVHLFADSNRHVGYSIMALYLICNGLPPIVFQDILQEEYTSTLFLAQAEKDSIPLYALVVQNIFNILMRYQA